MSEQFPTCPVCGGRASRPEADVGVGIIFGPASCENCGWVEPDPLESQLIEDGDDDWHDAWERDSFGDR